MKSRTSISYAFLQLLASMFSTYIQFPRFHFFFPASPVLKWSHRIKESYTELEGIHEDHSSQRLDLHRNTQKQTVFPKALSNYFLKSDSSMPSALHWGACSRARSPSGEENFPNSQPNPPLMQLHAIPLGPVAVTREQGSAPILLLPSWGSCGPPYGLPFSSYPRFAQPSVRLHSGIPSQTLRSNSALLWSLALLVSEIPTKHILLTAGIWRILLFIIPSEAYVMKWKMSNCL